MKSTLTILSRLKNKKAGVFIDDSNIYYAQKEADWKVDWKKFKSLLSEYCKISVFNYYIAIPAPNDVNYQSTERYIRYIEKIGKVRSKPLKYIKTAKAVIRKGDVDIEIALDVVRNIDNLDVVFVASGDSDYLELKKWIVQDKKKHAVFVSFEDSMSWELRQGWHIYLNRIKNRIKLTKKPRVLPRGSDAE